MSNVVFELFAKLGLDSSEYEEGLKDAENKATSIGGTIAGGLKTVGAAGAMIGTAIVGATAAAGTALVKGAGEVAAYGDNIDKMSQKMGISAEAYQEWDAVLQHSGTSIDSMSRGMQTLQKNAVNSAEKFEKLGLSQEQIAGMSTEELFAATIEGLQNMGEGAERTALASELLGGSAKELGALLNTSAADTQAMKDRVHELGGVMSNEAVKAAAAYQDSLQDMQTGFDGLKRNLMAEFLPSITGVMDGLTDIFAGDFDSGLSKISDGIKSLVDGITQKLPEVIQIGSSIVQTLATAVIDNLPTILQAGMELIGELGMALIENLPKIIEIGLQLILTLAQGIVEAIPELIPAIIDVITQIVTILTNPDTLMQLITAIVQIMMALGQAIITNIPTILNAIVQLISSAVNGLSNGDAEFLQKGLDFIMNLVSGIIDNLPQIVEAALNIIVEFIAAIAANLPQILEQGIIIIAKIIEGLLKAIPKLIAAIPKIIKAIVDTFKKHDWKSIGKNILEGIKNGIISSINGVVNAAKSAGQAIWNAIKSFFKISSPSKRMAWIGQMIDEGFAQGITNNMGLVDDAMSGLTSLMEEPEIATTAGVGAYSNSASVLSAMANENKDNRNLTVILELEKSQLARAVYKLNNEETQRVGLNLTGGLA